MSVSTQETQLPVRKGVIAQREGLKVVRLVVKAGGTVPEHHANVDVIATVVRGKGRFFVEGQPRAIAAGDVIDMAPAVPHAIEADEDLELVVVHARLNGGAGAPAVACGA
jgi:quercetin dioxygenase-like cupin family protein